jgi:hypothetical protein
MKKTLLTFSFLFILKIGLSQNSDYTKNEVSIGIINLTESPKNQENLFENSYYLVPFSNLTYKRFLNERNALRLTYFRPINKSYDNSIGSLFNMGEYKEQVLKIGYEYIFKQKRLTPYLAIDFSYFKSTSLRETGGGFAGIYNGSENEIKGFGLSPTIGINYNIIKGIYIGLESNLSILKFHEEKITSTNKIYPESDGARIAEKDDYFEYIFNPVVFLVKFKF